MSVLHVCGALIAWFAPEDVLTRYPLLKAVTTSVGEIFPLLSKAVEKSHFPEVTELYFALMLAATPIRLWGGIRFFWDQRQAFVAKYRRATSQVFIGLLGILGGGFFLLVRGQYFEINFIPISSSQLLLGLIGPPFAGGALLIVMATGVVAISVAFKTKTFKGN